MKSKSKSPWAIVRMAVSALIALALVPAKAAPVSVLSTTTAMVASSSSSTATLATGYSTTGVDKLVVVIAGEGGTSGTPTARTISSVTYADQPMQVAIKRDNGAAGYTAGIAGIYYLDNPSQYAASGDIVMTLSGRQNGSAVMIQSLGGTLPGVAATSATAGLSTSLTTVGANNFVIAAAQANSGTVPVPQSPLTSGLSYNGANSEAAAGYQTVVSASVSVTPTFAGGTTPMTLAAAFPPVDVVPALIALKNHINGTIPLNDAQIAAHKLTIDAGKALFGNDAEIITASFDLVTTYDTVLGPLFVSRSLPVRTSVTNDIHWTLYTVMQDIMDFTYNASNITNNYSLLNGFKFGSSASFPGSCAAPADPNLTNSATISASYLNTAGRETQGDGVGTYARKPTGTYLAPGSIATITVPAALVNAGFKIRVCAQSSDLSNRPNIWRLERSSLVYDITALATKIASPLGGGIYIEVPWLASAGTVSVQIKNAVRSPYFSAKSIQTTTPAQWLTERASPAPWADFQTDKFMMQVPTSWIYAMPDPTQLMADWDTSMDATTDLMGFPRLRGKESFYLQVDVDLKNSVFSPGYPAVNVGGFSATADYGGYNNSHYLVRGPQWVSNTVTNVEFHEQGHGFFFPKFPGEIESNVNLSYVTVLHQKFGFSLDEAFRSSLGYTNTFQTLDTTAMAWMTVFNFSPRKAAMAAGEKSYQLKGHAKFVDIARLFGWDKLKIYYGSYVEDPNGTAYTTDQLLLRLSTSVGKDIRPLFAFWGVYPDDPTTLASAITAAGLTPSREIYNALLHYRTLVPANNAAFQSFALSWWGRKPSITGAWEEREHARQWDTTPLYSAGDQQRSEATNPGEIYNENSANDIRNRIQELLDLYYPSGIPADNTPPVILTLSAPDDDTETSVSANLVVGFTKAVVIGTGNITLKNLTDATQATIAVTDASQVSIAGSVLTINPTANLLASKAYAIRIDATAIHDTAGNSFAGIANDTTWNFTTQSANSGLFTWDGTNNSWTSAHWNAGAPLVSGPAGDNNHNFATINGGTVTFAASDTFGNAGAMSSPVITINSGGTLASGGFFNTMWDITLNGGTLLANGGVNDPSGAFALKGTVTIGGSVASNISVGAGTNNTVSLGISTGGFTTFNVADVTASTAPDLTISTVLNNNSNVASGLIKTGAGTLVLTGNNTYTGGTTLSGGILQIGAGSTSGALLSNTNITNNATLVFNRSDASSFSGSIGGSGTVTKQGAGTLTLSGNNTYTGTTTVSGGVLSLATGLIYSNLGFPDKQITINGGATVAVGGWGDAATAGLGQVSFSSYNIVVNNGTIQYTGGYENGNLDRGFTIGANGATLDAAGGANTFTLNQGRNFGIASNDSGTLTLTGSSNGVLNLNLGGAGALVKSGTGTWTLTGNDTYTGGTTVNGGTLTLQAAGQAGIIRGSLNINSGATVNVDTNWSLGYGGPLGPYGGAGLSVNAITINGGVLNFTGNFDSNAGTTASTITMTGGSISGSDFGWYQANTTTPLLQTLASSSRATVSAGIGLRLGGDSNNLTFNVASGTTSAGIDLLVSGAISRATAGDGTAGGGIIKTGGGTMVLSGANTYTGATTVSMGTLALVGGSQASPITVSGGASLGFTLGSPTTSTSSFNLTAGTIKITGTPTLASYTLITSSSGITGTPALAAPISGYQLQKVGNTLILVNPFASWAATPAFGLAPGNQGATANPDNDSVNNLLEYVLNGNPSIPDAAILPTLAVTATDFEFTYSRSDASLADTIQTFEYGSNLAGWTPVLIPAGPGVSTVGIATVTITDTGATDSVKISIPRSANAGGKLFGRLKVVK